MRFIHQQRQQTQQSEQGQNDVGPATSKRWLLQLSKVESKPHKAETWIDKVEKAFRTMTCMDEDKSNLPPV